MRPVLDPILVVNPNTSTRMTDVIRAAATRRDSRIRLEVIQAQIGPESIECRLDEIVSAYWSIDAVLAHPERPSGVIVACFSNHPAVPALREAIESPVVDIMKPAVLAALSLARTFSIVTTSPRWSRMLWDDLRTSGFDRECVSIRNIRQSVQDVARLPRTALAAETLREARIAVDEDGAEVVCLGCAAMAGLEDQLAQTLHVPVMDGVRCAVREVVGKALEGDTTSGVGVYAPVEPRAVAGLPPGLESIYLERSPNSEQVATAKVSGDL